MFSLQVATLGKSGVSVGYYDTEMNAARAYDRAAIGLLGRDNCSITTNFPLQEYDEEVVPQLIGKTREEVKATLKNERAKVSPHDLTCSAPHQEAVLLDGNSRTKDVVWSFTCCEHTCSEFGLL